ncbi:MAG: ankyrin repeat domain-containing protein [Planctomycetota bacterium]
MMKSLSQPRFYRQITLAGAFVLIGPAAILTGCDDSAIEQTQQVSSASVPGISLEAAITQGDDHAVHAHIVAGTAVNTKSMMGDTPLHIAAAMGRPYAAEVLVGAGAELEAKNSSSVTPLFNAAFFCHGDVLKTLIDAGADTSTTDQNGTTIQQIMETPWEQIRPIYEMVYNSIGLPFDEQRIKSSRPKIATMLR